MYSKSSKMIELSARGEETHVPIGNSYAQDLAAMTVESLVIVLLMLSGSLSQYGDYTAATQLQ